MSIELVTHCWSVKHPPFAGALCYQLSSLILEPPKCGVTISVCYDPDDARTVTVVDFFDTIDPKLSLIRIPLSPGRLGRRSIGRNIAAKRTKADRIWFTDCDHVFREGCLDATNDFPWPDGATMIYLKRLKINATHAMGDAALASVMDSPRVVSVIPTEFVRKTYDRAIGGVHIVQGDYARKYGYIDTEKRWCQQPAKVPFEHFRDDIVFRMLCKGRGKVVPAKIRGLYRIRHSYRCYGGYRNTPWDEKQ